MIIIEKKGRFGIISNCPEMLNSALHNRLSYKKEGWEHIENKMWRTVYLYSKLTHRFLWGLIERVEVIVKQYCDKYNDTYEIKYTNYERFNHYSENWLEKIRPYQKEAALKIIEKHGGIISIPTRCGKTFIAVQYLKALNNWNKVLVVVTTKDLESQWSKELKDYENSEDKNISIHTYQYLSHHKELMNGNDIIIWDEVHHVSASVLYDLSKKCGNAIMVGLTATPFRNYQPEFLKIIASVGEIIYVKTIQEMTEQGYLVKAKVSIKKIDLGESVKPWENYNDIYNRFVVDNYIRNKFIIDKAKELASNNEMVLILIDKIPHGQILLSMLEDFNRKVFIHGKSKDRDLLLDEVKSGKYEIIISSKIYGEGVDIPKLTSLILACGGKSAVAIVQKSGRILTLFEGKKLAKLIDFNDNIDYLDKHFEKRLQIYNNLGFEVEDIE